MKSIFFALILLFTTSTPTIGFQLALTSRLVNLSRDKDPSIAITIASRSDISNNGSHGDNILVRGHSIRHNDLLNKPSTVLHATTSSPIYRSHDQVKNSKPIIKRALTATLCLLSTLIHRPNVAAATTIPPSPLSSISIVDPAMLTTTTEGLSVLNPGTNKSTILSFLVTSLSTIRMKQQAMALYALAVGMTVVLLKCAEGGYVRFVEFVAESCLGYYGIHTSRYNEKMVSREGDRPETKGWNDYVLHLPRRKKGGLAGMDNDNFTVDKKTMLFQRRPVASVVKGRDDIMMEKANQSYREKQYAQHHHDPVQTFSAASTSSSSTSHYLDTLSRSSWDKYKATLNSMSQSQAEHDETSNKLQIMKNMLTWDDYKHLVTELQLKKEECTKLQEEVKSLKKVLQVERTVHHFTPQEVTSVSSGGGGDDDKELELKTLEDKAKAYEEAIQESKVNEDSVRWH